jgi:hypothetical protein
MFVRVASGDWQWVATVGHSSPCVTITWPDVVRGESAQVGVELVVREDETPPPAAANLYSMGEDVLYRTSLQSEERGKWVPAKVVAILNCVFPPSYGIQLPGGGAIRETDADRLRKL